jgi:hypothetical protein
MERSEAIMRGLPTYDTGRSCVHGHPSIRYTKTGICVECAKSNTTRSRQKAAKMIAAKEIGLKRVDAWVHRDDFEIVRATINAANLMRGLPLLDEPAAPAPSRRMTDDEIYQAHVSIHGKDVADKLRLGGL